MSHPETPSPFWLASACERRISAAAARQRGQQGVDVAAPGAAFERFGDDVRDTASWAPPAASPSHRLERSATEGITIIGATGLAARGVISVKLGGRKQLGRRMAFTGGSTTSSLASVATVEAE